MWLRSEKRSSRIAPTNNKSTINLRKIIKNTPALKNLKQTTTNVTSSRRSGVCTTTTIANSSKTTFRNSGEAKQSPSSKCNIKSRTGVKRLGKKSGTSLSKRYGRKKLDTSSERSTNKQQYGRVRGKSRIEIGKENCWQNQGQLNEYTIDGKRGRRRAGVGCGSTDDAAENLDSASNKETLSSVEAVSCLVIVNDVCDSCKPSTTCNCSSSSSQSDSSQSTSGLNVPKNDCVNYIECDSTTDNDRTNLPSTSMLVTVSCLFRSSWKTPNDFTHVAHTIQTDHFLHCYVSDCRSGNRLHHWPTSNGSHFILVSIIIVLFVSVINLLWCGNILPATIARPSKAIIANNGQFATANDNGGCIEQCLQHRQLPNNTWPYHIVWRRNEQIVIGHVSILGTISIQQCYYASTFELQRSEFVVRTKHIQWNGQQYHRPHILIVNEPNGHRQFEGAHQLAESFDKLPLRNHIAKN